MRSHIPTLPLEGPRRLLVLCYACVSGAALLALWNALNAAAPVLSFALWGLAALALGEWLVQAAVSWNVSHRPVPVPPQPLPATDVLVWAGRHDPGVLLQSMRSAQALIGPHTLYLLEMRSADTERLAALQALSEDIDCTLVVSDGANDDAAALANRALALGAAPFVAWLDGSHACRRDFLHNTLGHFADPMRAFVQTAPGVPGESAPGPRPRGADRDGPWARWLAAFVPALSRRQWHLGWDRWNASLWTGSGAVLRRSALQAAGGFAGRSADLFLQTTARLQGQGLHGVWHAERMAFSVAPEAEASAVERPSVVAAWAAWRASAAGHRPGLTLAQRLRHLAEAIDASLPLMTAAGLALPALAILAGGNPLSADPMLPAWGLALLLTAAIALGALMQLELSAGAHGPLQRLGHRLTRLGRKPQATLLALSAVGVAVGVVRAAAATGESAAAGSAPPAGWLLLSGWCLLNAGLLVSAMQAARRVTGRVRHSQRFAVTLAAELIDPEGTRVHGTIDDLSRGGLRFYGSLLPTIALQQRLLCTLHLPDGPLMVAGEVRHLGGRDRDTMHQPRSVGLKLIPNAAHRRRIEAFLFSSDLQWRLQGQVERGVTPLARLFPEHVAKPASTLARRRWNGAQLRLHVQADATPVLCSAPGNGPEDDGKLVVSHVELPEDVPLILDVFRRRTEPSCGVTLQRIEDASTVGAEATALFAYRALPTEMPGVPMEYLVAASPFVLVEDEPLVIDLADIGTPESREARRAAPILA